MIETLAQKLEEKSKEQMELHYQNLNLQEALKKAANFSGIGEGGVKRGSGNFPV